MFSTDLCPLTDGEGVHPTPAVGGQLQWHPGRGERIDERPLGGVASRTDVQGGLSTSHCESSWSTGVPLRLHFLQHLCQNKTKKEKVKQR